MLASAIAGVGAMGDAGRSHGGFDDGQRSTLAADHMGGHGRSFFG